MAKPIDTHAALAGTLDKEVYLDLLVYQEFLDNRKRIMQAIYGDKTDYNQVRDDLVRYILIEFGKSSSRNISFYQKKLAYLVNHDTTRRELSFLERRGLVVIGSNEQDRRANIVRPTRRLVEWYCTQLPRLFHEIRKFLATREEDPTGGLE